MESKLLEQLLSELYQYAVIGGILILGGILLKSFIATLATNIWMRIFSRSRITDPDNLEIYMEGEWWKVKKIGFNRTKLFRKNLDEKGNEVKEDPDIFLEMPTTNYWKGIIIYK